MVACRFEYRNDDPDDLNFDAGEILQVTDEGMHHPISPSENDSSRPIPSRIPSLPDHATTDAGRHDRFARPVNRR